MNIIFLAIGTILSILFIILMFNGSKYDYMLESLSGDEFPLKTIYSVGMAWQDFKIARLKGSFADKLRSYSSLLYSKKYSEFYARITWAQVLSFAHMCLAIFFLFAGFARGSMSTFFCVVGIVFTFIVSYYFISLTKEKVIARRDECEKEFPNAISKLALIVNSGVILHDAWNMVAYGKDGTFYLLMKESCDQIKNGMSEVDAIYDFGTKTNSDDIKKFTSALIQSIERGGGDLSQFLANQSSELWSNKRQVMLQKGEKASGALLMPIALMFFGVMLLVIAAAMQSFSI